jgi:hypothetical protein
VQNKDCCDVDDDEASDGDSTEDEADGDEADTSLVAGDDDAWTGPEAGVGV